MILAVEVTLATLVLDKFENRPAGPQPSGKANFEDATALEPFEIVRSCGLICTGSPGELDLAFRRIQPIE